MGIHRAMLFVSAGAITTGFHCVVGLVNSVGPFFTMSSTTLATMSSASETLFNLNGFANACVYLVLDRQARRGLLRGGKVNDSRDVASQAFSVAFGDSELIVIFEEASARQRAESDIVALEANQPLEAAAEVSCAEAEALNYAKGQKSGSARCGLLTSGALHAHQSHLLPDSATTWTETWRRQHEAYSVSEIQAPESWRQTSEAGWESWRRTPELVSDSSDHIAAAAKRDQVMEPAAHKAWTWSKDQNMWIYG